MNLPFSVYAVSIPVSVVPALVLLGVFRRLDRRRRAPLRALYLTMALGAAACVPAALIEWLEGVVLGDASLVGGRFVDAFVIAALTEESLKLLVVLGFAMRHGSFDEVTDGIVYAVAASLGLGLLENVAFAATDVETGIARALTAVPMHAIASGVMGYFVGRARFAPSNSVLPLAMAGLFFAVLIHGAYDWAVYAHDVYWALEAVTVLVGGGAALAVLLHRARRMDDAMLGRTSLPPALSSWPTDVTSTLVPALTRRTEKTEPDETDGKV